MQSAVSHMIKPVLSREKKGNRTNNLKYNFFLGSIDDSRPNELNHSDGVSQKYLLFRLNLGLSSIPSFPTNLFTILEPQDQVNGEFYLVQERRTTDFKAPKL